MTQKRYSFEPDYAVAPGETLGEVIGSLDMSKKGLATRIELTEQTINRIFKGEQPITYETANKLELVTGVPARMWNNLEARYREQLAKIEEHEQFEEDIEWLKDIPVRELMNRNAIPNEKDKILQLREALKFYGVSSVDAWRKIWDTPKVAARRSNCFETRKGPASAWIRLGELQAHGTKSRPFNRNKFKNALKAIRRLTVKNPTQFVPKMKKACADAGVALSLVEKIKNVPWNGATKWLSPTKAMILLNLRGRGEDRFWFSFFHEACHVLRDKKTGLYIADSSTTDKKELRADAFAAEVLILRKYSPEIKTLRSRADVVALAKKLGICPGIVAGQYQHLTKKWAHFKDLINNFVWTEDDE